LLLVPAVCISFSATPGIAQDATTLVEITPEMRDAFNEARPYCETDAAKFCRWVVPGGGRVVTCMLDSFENLSPTCQQKISEIVPQ
jgi:hypothetical protein